MKKRILKSIPLAISISLIVLSIFLSSHSASGATVPGTNVTYTTDADFDYGTLVNINHDDPSHNQLQLSKVTSTFPFIWIALSGRGTIAKVDIVTGKILGEYYSAPNGCGRNPSRTTVDLNGNVWASNRDESSGGKGSIVRIGLKEKNQCVDRNGNGVIDTSTGFGDIRPWPNPGGVDNNGGVSSAQDECIINYTRVIATNTRTVAIDANNDVWVGGANTAHEKVSGVTGQPVHGTQFNLGCGGYGGLIDKNGVLWSARFGSGLLRFNTKTMTGACLGSGRGDYGLALDPKTGNIWHTFLTGNRVAKLAPDGTLLGIYAHGDYYAQGVVVDNNGNVWVAHSLYRSTVGHLRTDGTFVGNVSTGSGPTGVSVDANGKVWSTNYYSWTASRIDPNGGPVGGGGYKTGAVDMTVYLGSNAYPYNYSDMTGQVVLSSTSPQGTWEVVQDSGVIGNQWGTITWNTEPEGNVPSGSVIIVEALAADTEAGLGSQNYIAVSNASPFKLIGRFIQVRVTLKPNTAGISPVLSDIRVSRAPLTNVRVIDTISTANIEIDLNSFTKTPYSITTAIDQAIIEWRFDTFAIDQIEDLSFDVILKNPISGENRLVNQRLEVLYTDINGNAVRTELGPHYVHVLNSAFDSGISADKPIYQANEDALISAKITNLSEYARTIDAKVLIEDRKGALVKEITTLSNLNFNAGETKSFSNLIFNTATTYAGDYRAHLILYENQKQVGEALTNFKIQPTIAITSKVTTDKIAYNANEQVTITSQIQSTSPNYILQNLVAKISLINRQGQILFTEEKTIPILTMGQLTELKTYWNTSTNPKGTYMVKLEVLESGTILSTSTATFEILGSSETGTGLTGTITAQPNPVYQGRDETITYTVTNNGNEDIGNLSVRVIIVDPDTQAIKTEYSRQYTVGRRETITEVNTVSTATLTPKTYLVILQAGTSTMSEPKTIASTTFEVKPGIEITKTFPDVKNVLVWLNYPWQSGQNCPDRALIEQALNEAGVSYHIVLDKKEFETELRNPYHTDFMILGDHNPIEDHFSEELREQVYSGKGLISSLFNRQNLDEEVFGIKFNGHLSGNDYPIELLESEIASQGSFQSYGRALKVGALNIDKIIAWIVETTKKRTNKYPGIIKRQYGEGNVLFYAFDLGMSSQNYNQFATLLKNSLNYVGSPLDTTAFYPNQLIPVEIKIKSLGGAFDLKITETYPAEITIYDPSAEKWITENPWVINIHLEPNETKAVLYYASAPDRADTYILQTEVGYMENGGYNFYQSLSTEIVINQDTATIESDILTALNALSVSGQDRAKVNNAIRYIQNVKNRVILTDADIEQNISDLLKAIDSLLSVTSVDILSIRLMMDELLKAWEGRYYL